MRKTVNGVLNGYDATGNRVSEATIDGVPVEEWERRQEPRPGVAGAVAAVIAVIGTLLLLALLGGL